VTTTSYWLEEPREELRSAPGSSPPDVAVIGGGVTGCSCALTLAQRGVGVCLYEAREIAGGASGRNGGFALRGAAAPYDIARRDLGQRGARELMELTERSLERIERLAGDAFRRLGSLRLAADDDEREALRREHDALRADGFAVEWLAPEQLAPPLDALYHGAILHPADGALAPARWVRRLAGAAAAAGAEIREGKHVDVDELDAEAVVVAADGLTASVLPDLAGIVNPTRGQVLVTEPQRELLYERPHYARGGYDYWHQLRDGRLVIGGNRDAALAAEQTDVEEISEPVQARIEELAGRLLGHAPVVTHRWAGIWGTTPDLVPLVGRVPGRERVWVAGGYSGHGNALGFACGDLVARAILGDPAPELALFDPARLFVGYAQPTG
jgi:gamma-glutamylputrescine oxidase